LSDTGWTWMSCKIALNDFPFQDRSQLCERLGVNQVLKAITSAENELPDFL
jgi:hypothetical protein